MVQTKLIFFSLRLNSLFLLVGRQPDMDEVDEMVRLSCSNTMYNLRKMCELQSETESGTKYKVQLTQRLTNIY